MAGVRLKYDLSDIETINLKIKRLCDIDKMSLADIIGGTVESQTLSRLTSEKETPDGTPWPLWSEKYKKTRHGNHDLLAGDSLGGGLIGSIDFEVSPKGDVIFVGSNLDYSATHQFGDEERGIPARTYLGLSDENKDELEKVIDDFIISLLK